MMKKKSRSMSFTKKNNRISTLVPYRGFSSPPSQRVDSLIHYYRLQPGTFRKTSVCFVETAIKDYYRYSIRRIIETEQNV